jgi:hypothetical protein
MFKMLPPHGWRAVWWELGVVTLGVLIALAAQQTVEDIHRRADQRALRETIDHEVGLNLFTYQLRARQFACGEERIVALRSWLERSRSGEQVPALLPRAPYTLSSYHSAWDNRDPEVFNGLSSNLRQKYSEFYDELSNNNALIQGEAVDWAGLIPYAEAGPITLADRRFIRASIYAIRNAQLSLKGNLPLSVKIAEVLQVKAVKPDNIPPEFLNVAGECPSLIAAPA